MRRRAAGFGVAHDNGVWNYGIFTAGHCGAATWHEAEPTGTTIGTTSQNHFSDADPIDVQVMPIAAANRSNQYLDGGSGCSDCALRAITVTQGHDADEPGDAVCNHGAFSGTKCGSIISTNAPLDYLGEHLLRMRRASYARTGGDSGGPVTSAANTAAGSHTHYKVISGVEYAYYTHIWEMESISGWDVYHG